MMKHRKWKINEQAGFLKRIGELLMRGYPIADAIESLSFQLPPYKKAELKECLISLNNGLTFYDVLSNLKFNEEMVGYVYFAEKHGSFAEALLEASSLALKKENEKHKLMKLLQYPFILMAITGLLFVFVEKILLPRFTTLFHSLNLEANFFTTIVVSFGTYFPILLIFSFTMFFLAALYYLIIFRNIPILLQKAQLVRIPLLGRCLKLLYTHYFSIQLSFLLSGGMSFFEALILFETNRRQLFYSKLAEEIKLKLMAGEKLESILPSFPFLNTGLPWLSGMDRKMEN